MSFASGRKGGVCDGAKFEGGTMGIESLTKAAEAAGYAMAAPDDEPAAAPQRVQADVESRALLLAAPRVESTGVQETVTAATGWLKGYLPAFGGRAPA